MKFFKKKPKIKKFVILAAVIAVVGVALFMYFRPKPQAVTPMRTAPLTVMDLKNTVDVTGTVESEDKYSVYTSLVTPVLEVAVEVGDVVAEGDLLCKLDTTSIESDILSRQANISSGAKSSSIALQQAQEDLENAEKYLKDGQNAEILAAESSLAAAERSVTSAEFSVRSVENTLSSAQDDNRKARREGNDPVHSDASMDRYRDSVSQAYLEQEAAELKVEEAKQKLERAKQDAEKEIARLKDKVTSAQLAADQTTDYITLDKLKSDLADCTVTAPGAGTVTAVYASEGYEAKGLLFVIEDTGALIVNTTIKEFDINTVKPGQKVLIKSDATGEDVYDGEITSIAPASLKNASGETVTGSTAEYQAKIKVTSTNHMLHIGMNVRLNIIVEQKDQVMAVLYDSVVDIPREYSGQGSPQGPRDGEPPVGPQVQGPQDGQGSFRGSEGGEGSFRGSEGPRQAVFVARPQEDGSHIAVMVPVETGMETDLYMEVYSPDLKEGDLILSDPAEVTDGMTVVVASGIGAESGQSDQGGRGGFMGGPGGGPGGGGAVRVRMG